MLEKNCEWMILKKWFKRCGQSNWMNRIFSSSHKTPKWHRSTSQWGRATFYRIRSRSHEISFSFVVPFSFHRNAVFILITLVLLSQTSFLMLNSYYMFQSICMSASCSRSADSKQWKIILPHDFMMAKGDIAQMIASYECHIVHCSGNIKLIILRWVELMKINRSATDWFLEIFSKHWKWKSRPKFTIPWILIQVLVNELIVFFRISNNFLHFIINHKVERLNQLSSYYMNNNLINQNNSRKVTGVMKTTQWHRNSLNDIFFYSTSELWLLTFFHFCICVCAGDYYLMLNGWKLQRPFIVMN